MKQDEIIEMAEKAGFTTVWKKQFILSPYGFEDADLREELEAFAKLIAAKERERVEDLCMRGTQLAVLVAKAEEREACADNVETYYDPMWTEHYCAGIELAKMIRARGEA